MIEKSITKIIYHIATLKSWKVQETNSYYCHESLATEGFVHCCEAEQLDGVLERYFKGVNDLILLEIDVEELSGKLVFEKSHVGEYFPHIYSPIEMTAIKSVKKIR